MLTPAEIAMLENLLIRARHAATGGHPADALTPGDVAQLRPGASATWDTSLFLVCQANRHQVRGQILRPHRGGCRLAWSTFTPPGPALYPAPPLAIRAWCYAPPCARSL